MRISLVIVVILLALGWAGTYWDGAALPAEPSVSAEDRWRRTSDGWEKANAGWSEPVAGNRLPHPLVVGSLQLLISCGALVAADRSSR